MATHDQHFMKVKNLESQLKKLVQACPDVMKLLKGFEVSKKEISYTDVSVFVNRIQKIVGVKAYSHSQIFDGVRATSSPPRWNVSRTCSTLTAYYDKPTSSSTSDLRPLTTDDTRALSPCLPGTCIIILVSFPILNENIVRSCQSKYSDSKSCLFMTCILWKVRYLQSYGYCESGPTVSPPTADGDDVTPHSGPLLLLLLQPLTLPTVNILKYILLSRPLKEVTSIFLHP